MNNNYLDLIGGIHAQNIPVKSVDLSDPVINSEPEPFLVQFHDLPQDRLSQTKRGVTNRR